MWPSVASMCLTFGAMAWSIISIALCFFYAAPLWIAYFGRFGAFYSAIFAFGVCFIGARLMLRLADRMIEPYRGPYDDSAYTDAPADTFYRDWPRYTADLIRNRRYAFYMRTGQREKLRALEAEMAAAGPTPVSPPDPPHPRRTSMENRVTFEERRRGSRRTASPVPRTERWSAIEG